MKLAGRFGRKVFTLFAIASFLFACASNFLLYFSNEHFPTLAKLQINHPKLSSRPIRSRHTVNWPMIVGHRGRGRISTNPEVDFIGNTKHAIKSAIYENPDWIEIDVRKTGDSRTTLVVFHDEYLDKKTTGSGKVEEQQLGTLQSHEVLVGRINNEPERILTLNEVFLEFHQKGRRWILDIKSKGVRNELLRLIDKYLIPPEHIILFGDHEVLRDYADTDFRRGYTTLFSKHTGMLISYSNVLKRCEENEYSLLVVPIVFVTPRLIRKAEKMDIEVWSYGSNHPKDLQYCLNCGIKGLIVDHPRSVIEQLKTRKSQEAASD